MQIISLFLVASIHCKSFLPVSQDYHPAQPTLLRIPFSISKAGPKESGSIIGDYVAATLTGTIGLGSPPQALKVLVDTGSSLFWVRSAKCNSTECRGKSAFDSSKSTTYKSIDSFTGQQQTILYGDGTRINCTVQEDSLQLGRIRLRNQRVCEAYLIETNAPSTDGIIGIGPPGGRSSPADVFGLLSATLPDSNKLVSFFYNIEKKGMESGTAGEITFGGIDSNRYSGDIWYQPITTDRSHWHLSLSSIRLAGSEDTLLNPSNLEMIVDTGTTVTFLPSPLAQTFNQALNIPYNSVHGYSIPCSNTSTFKPISLYFSGNQQPLTLDYNQMFLPSLVNSEICMSPIQAGSRAILGANILRNFYTIFDFGAARIGIAKPVYETFKVDEIDHTVKVNGTETVVDASSPSPSRESEKSSSLGLSMSTLCLISLLLL